MDKEKHDRILKEEKFETLVFAADYIQSIKEITGEFNRDDIFDSLLRIYDEAFKRGQRDILDRAIYSMHKEIDSIEEQA